MKRIQLLSAAAILITAVAITSCSSGRVYYSQTPYHSSFSLIVTPTPGFVTYRYPDGRYYYRSPEGYTYWRGYDNRFYLDRSHLGRVHYNQREYNEWNRNNNRYPRRRHY